MLYQEEKEVGGKRFLHTYSDEFYILQNETGIEYEDAMDLIPCPYTYSETDKPLNTEPTEPENE